MPKPAERPCCGRWRTETAALTNKCRSRLLPPVCCRSNDTLMARVHSWVFLTNSRDTDTTIPLNISSSLKFAYPWCVWHCSRVFVFACHGV
jgi:hypothetical protein